VRVGADDEGRVPVPAQRLVAAPDFGLDAHALARALVEARERAVLVLGVDRVRVGRIDLRAEAVAAEGDEPVGVDDAVRVARARRPPEVEVVLRAAVDVVEGRRVVGRHVVELRDGEVLFEVPVLPAIPALVDAAVAADEVVARVVWIDPDVVVIDVLRSLAQRLERAPAVVRDEDQHVHHVDAIHVFRIGDDARVVHRRHVVGVAPLPTLPAIRRAEDAAPPLLRLDRRVEDVRVRGRDGEADATEVARGQARPDLLPRRARVGRFVERAFGAAVDERPVVSASLVGRGVDGVGVVRIDYDVGDAGVLADVERALPRLAAVGRLEEAAVAARPPERPLRRDVDHVGVARINHDATDVLRLFQADVAPRLAAVLRLVDAVAVGDAALRVVLARPDPDDERVLLIHRDPADGVRALVVEDRAEGRPAVLRPPHPARSRRDEVLAVIARIDGEGRDATRREGGAD
jgi:hypothetical protein